MRLLLIGVSGMMGTALTRVCDRKGLDYVGLTHGDLEITDFDAVRKAVGKYKPDTVINLAVLQAIDPCELQPQRAFSINTIAVENLAKICKERGITLVQPSTHAVFDGRNDSPDTEDDLTNPLSIYGASKYVAECFTRNICTKYYIVRFPTMFGSSKSVFKGFVEKMIGRIRNGEEVRAAEDKLDSPTYTMDAAEAVVSILEEEKPFGIYHITNSGVASFYDLIAKVIEIMGVEANLVRARYKEFGGMVHKPLKSALASVKLKPLRDWQDALYEYITTEVK